MQHRVLDVPSMGYLASSTLGHRVIGEIAPRHEVGGRRVVPCPGRRCWSRTERRQEPVGLSSPWAISELLLQPLDSACWRDQTLPPSGTMLRSCCCWHCELRGVSAHASALSLQRAIYLPSSLAVPRSYLRILILICFRIRYILALQHCAAMTTGGLHFCCFHTLVFLVLGLFPSSCSLALKTWLHLFFFFFFSRIHCLFCWLFPLECL